MKMFGKDFSVFLITICIFVVAFLISLGLCGLDPYKGEEFGGSMSLLGFVGMIISVAGFIVTTIVWIIYSILRRFNK